MGYVAAGIFGGAALAVQAAQAAPAPIRLPTTVITVSPPNPGAGGAIAALQANAGQAATNYVVPTAPSSSNTMLYLAGAALLAGVFLMKR